MILTLTKFQIERPIECAKVYPKWNTGRAVTYTQVNSNEGGHLAVMAVDALLNDGTEYEVYYKVSHQII